MSKTIRRKNGHDRLENRYTRDFVRVAGDYLRYVQYEGKALEKGLALYHSDNYVTARYANRYPKRDRHIQHKIDRARVSNELARYKKDDEHEVLVRKNPHFNYWY